MSGAVLGAIEVQMLMDLARWKDDVGNAGRVMDQGLAKMKSSISAVLGGLTAGMGVAAFASMIKSSIDAAEALHDMAIQTGASVESLSAMQAVGKTTGTSVDVIGAAMNKLAKNMAVGNEESKGTGQAIKALGLNFDELKRMKPDQQMLAVAQAMNKFEDGSGKSAVAMTLLGREGAKLLPFMKDLAENGALVATVTTEQAAAADAYNDSVTRSHMRLEDLRRSIAMGVLPVLIALHDMTGELGHQIGEYLGGQTKSAAVGFDYLAGVIRVVGTVLESLVIFGSDVIFVFKAMGIEIGGIAAQAVALASGDFAGVAAIHREMVADAEANRAALDEFQAKVAGATDKILQSRDALKSHSLSTAENNNELARLSNRYGATKKAVLDFTAAGEDAGKKQRVTLAKLLDSYAKMADATALKIIAEQAELETGHKLTQAEQDYIKVMIQVRDGEVTLAQVTRDGTLDKLKANMVAAQSLELTKEELKWLAESEKANQAANDTMLKTTAGLREQLAKQLESNAAIGQTATQLAEREAATLRDTAAALDNQAAWAADVDWSGKMSAELREQARLLRERATGVESGALLTEAKATADEWKKTTGSIKNGLTDALLRAFESGKGFLEAFTDTLKNAFKLLVLKPMVDSMVDEIGGGLQGVMKTLGQGTTSLWGGGAAGGVNHVAGYTESAGGAGAGAASSLGWVGFILAGIQQSQSDYAKGWRRDGLDQGWNKNINWAINPVYGGLIKPLEKLGLLSGKSADILGGDTAMARMFGRKPAEATAMGVSGAFGGGGFLGSQFVDWKAKGGWFRSDKSGTNTSALDAELGAALGSGAKAMLAQTSAYAAALALPVTALASVSSTARIELGDDAAKNAAAITAALGDYGTALVKDYEAALSGVSQPGEAATDTLARLGESMLTVNGAFETLGLHLVRTSVAGGAAAAELVTLTGGLDAFMSKTQSYLGNYFTQAEQMGLGAGNVLKSLSGAGIDFGGATGRGDLRSLMEGLDPNSATGRAQMAALLNVSADFAKIGDYLASSGLTLGQLAGQAPTVGLLIDDPATRSATAAEQSAALLQTSTDHLGNIANSSASSNAQLQALLALQTAANQALLAQLAALQQAIDDAARLADLAPPPNPNQP